MHLLRVFIFFVCLIVPNLHSSFAAESMNTFTDDEYGYSIQYPQGWKANIYRSGVVLSNINNADDTSGLQIRYIPSKQNISRFTQDYIKSFNQDMPTHLTKKGNVFIDNKRGYELFFEMAQRKNAYFLISYILPHPGREGYYAFQAGVPWESRDKLLPIIQNIARSFKMQN